MPNLNLNLNSKSKSKSKSEDPKRYYTLINNNMNKSRKNNVNKSKLNNTLNRSNIINHPKQSKPKSINQKPINPNPINSKPSNEQSSPSNDQSSYKSFTDFIKEYVYQFPYDGSEYQIGCSMAYVDKYMDTVMGKLKTYDKIIFVDGMNIINNRDFVSYFSRKFSLNIHVDYHNVRDALKTIFKYIESKDKFKNKVYVILYHSTEMECTIDGNLIFLGIRCMFKKDEFYKFIDNHGYQYSNGKVTKKQQQPEKQKQKQPSKQLENCNIIKAPIYQSFDSNYPDNCNKIYIQSTTQNSMYGQYMLGQYMYYSYMYRAGLIQPHLFQNMASNPYIQQQLKHLEELEQQKQKEQENLKSANNQVNPCLVASDGSDPVNPCLVARDGSDQSKLDNPDDYMLCWVYDKIKKEMIVKNESDDMVLIYLYYVSSLSFNDKKLVMFSGDNYKWLNKKKMRIHYFSLNYNDDNERFFFKHIGTKKTNPYIIINI